MKAILLSIVLCFGVSVSYAHCGSCGDDHDTKEKTHQCSESCKEKGCDHKNKDSKKCTEECDCGNKKADHKHDHGKDHKH